MSEFTPEHEIELRKYTAKWEAVSRSTAPIKRSTVPAALEAYYRYMKRPFPGVVYFAPSPIGVMYAVEYLTLLAKHPKQCQALQNKYRGDTQAAIDALTFNVPVDEVREMRDVLRPLAAKNQSDHMQRFICPQADKDWLAHHQCMHEVCGKDKADGFDEVSAVALNVSFWMPFVECIVVTDRPLSISFEEQDRLHNEKGYAISFRDGTGKCAWHDVIVPSAWILDRKNLTPQTVLAEKNAEVRRCGGEIVGWDKMISLLKHKVIDEDPNPMIGTLIEAQLPEGKRKFLRVLCGTGRTFMLYAPMTARTALEANAATWEGLDPKLLRLMTVRT